MGAGGRGPLPGLGAGSCQFSGNFSLHARVLWHALAYNNQKTLKGRI